jgi:hypothetical protein
MTDSLPTMLADYDEQLREIIERRTLLGLLEEKNRELGQRLAKAVSAGRTTGHHDIDISFLLTKHVTGKILDQISKIEEQLRSRRGQLAAIKKNPPHPIHILRGRRQLPHPSFAIGIIGEPELQICRKPNGRNFHPQVIVPVSTVLLAYPVADGDRSTGFRYELRLASERKIDIREQLLGVRFKGEESILIIGDDHFRTDGHFLLARMKDDFPEPLEHLRQLLGYELQGEGGSS